MGGLYANIWRYADGARAQLVACMTMLVAAAVLELMPAWFASKAIDALQKNGSEAFLHAAGYITAVLGVSGAAWGLHGPGRVMERNIALRIRRKFADALYAKLLRLPMSWHDQYQRQRLCLARGLLAARASSLIMLDEPTSALDPVTEETVLSRITLEMPDACVVASVHRMSLLRHFNKVVLMANGRVQDAGTVQELLTRQVLFREMLGQQYAAPEIPLSSDLGLGMNREAQHAG